MPTIKNQNPDQKIEKGTTLAVSGAASENDAILAVENYLREHRSEGLEVAVSGRGEGDSYEVKLG